MDGFVQTFHAKADVALTSEDIVANCVPMTPPSIATVRAIVLLAAAWLLPPLAAAMPRLQPASSPEAAGFSSEGLARVDALIEDAVAHGFPGAVLAIVRDGQLVKLDAYGYAKRHDENGLLAEPPPMRVDTVFDLASNTKMYAATFALQRLVYEGRIVLDAPLQRYLPGFVDGDDDPVRAKHVVTVADLLRHSAGMPADPPYHDRARAGSLYSQDRERTAGRLLRTPLETLPGTAHRYSDPDFMLLGMLVEHVSGQRLDEYVDAAFYAPLGLQRTLFAPLRGNARLPALQASDCAATEPRGNTRDGAIRFDGIRTHTLQCEVHDEKAFHSMDQVSGHAGLFADAADLAELLQLMLDGGRRADHVFFDPDTISVFTRPAELDPSHGLGWRLNRGERMRHLFGRHAPTHAYGHTGWTGTATVIDPKHRLGIVLLTNRKNTPVLDPTNNPNRFLGDTFEPAEYGRVVDAIYEAMRPDVYDPRELPIAVPQRP